MGSEMCIRDSYCRARGGRGLRIAAQRLSKYSIANLYYRASQKKNQIHNALSAGTEIKFDADLTVEALWPNKNYSVPDEMIPEEDGTFTNNSSSVLRLAYKNKVFLFTGDIESEVERSLIAECPEKLRCDVLKIPHHGSITSSTQEFVKKTNADYGVITT